MATWITHLRIADRFIEAINVHRLNVPAFIMGNIAPDAGTLNPDGLTYTPDKSLTHYKIEGGFAADKFRSDYLTDFTDFESFSFYLGYYLHLLTDNEWANRIYRIQKAKNICKYSSESEMMRDIKRDWYGIDRVFLKNNPCFRSY